MKKKLSLQRETIQALEGSAIARVAAGFSGIGTCIRCNVTMLQGTCGTTSTCPR